MGKIPSVGKDTTMKIYKYATAKKPFSLMSVPLRGMVHWDLCYDTNEYSGYVYYFEKWNPNKLAGWNMVFLGTHEI